MANSEVESEFTGMHRARAAERHQRELARVEAALHRDDADRPLHVGVDHANNAARRGERVGPHRAPQPFDHMHRALGVELHPAAEKILGDEPARNQISVGDGWEIATAVARGTGVGAGALRPTLSEPPASTDAIEPPPAPTV